MFANFENDSFLLDCLMSCSRNTSVNLLDLTNEQLNKWSQLKNAPVISERIQQFEHTNKYCINFTWIIFEYD